MTTPTYATTPAYCTDEDVAVHSPGDVGVLTPRSSTLAFGVDGVFAIGSPWVLTSATVDFEANGVKPAMLVVLTGGTPGVAKGSGDLYAVGAVSGSSLTLRRIGFGDGVGQPPGPTAGATAVDFRVCSLSPQIGQASDELNRLYGIDASCLYRSPDYIADLRDLELATVLKVLVRQYTVNNRVGDGDFAMKMKTLQADRDAALERVRLRWLPPANLAPPSSASFVPIVRS